MRLAIIGVTGLVGREIVKVLEEFNIQPDEFIPVASPGSVGKSVLFNGRNHQIRSIEEAIEMAPDFAIFSAGGTVSKEFAPKFASKGTVVIDNSSAWRMEPGIKLVVPEVNGSILTKEDKIISNPNCSTIQMVLALAPLHKKYRIKRLVISTYQSFTGTGALAVRQYEAEKAGKEETCPEKAYPHPIFENCLPHCDIFLENDYTKEEMKLVNETRKILDDPGIAITATAVRVPVNGGHSESVNIEFERPFDLAELKEILSNEAGIIVQDDVRRNIYPMPVFARGRNEVFVGRIRRDESIDKGVNMWIVADNLRKGAATNAVQIMQHLMN